MLDELCLFVFHCVNSYDSGGFYVLRLLKMPLCIYLYFCIS